MLTAAIITSVFAFSVLVFTIYLLIKIRQERMKQLKEWDERNNYSN